MKIFFLHCLRIQWEYDPSHYLGMVRAVPDIFLNFKEVKRNRLDTYLLIKYIVITFIGK